MRKAALSVIAVVLVVACGIWLLGREATLVYAAHHLVERLGGRLELVEVRGSLLGEMRLAKLRFHDEFGRVEVDDAPLRWRPLRLLIGQVSFSEAVAKVIAVELAPSTSSEPPAPPRSLASPISVAIENLAVESLSLSRPAPTISYTGSASPSPDPPAPGRSSSDLTPPRGETCGRT